MNLPAADNKPATSLELADRYLGNGTWALLAVAFFALIMNPVTVGTLRTVLASLVLAVVALNFPTCILLYRDFRKDAGSTRVTLRMVSLLLRFGATALAIQLLVERAVAGVPVPARHRGAVVRFVRNAVMFRVQC